MALFLHEKKYCETVLISLCRYQQSSIKYIFIDNMDAPILLKSLEIILQAKLVTKKYEANIIHDFINNFFTHSTRMPILLEDEFESMHVKVVNVRGKIHVGISS